ncbi:MAG TPA: hypothetical protein VFE32_16710 [Puia sp.]|jgi:hypothetical protein|nr:hypothetical protein [Puia sp.]
MFKLLLLVCTLLFSFTSWAQTRPVIVAGSLRIPIDSVRKEQMIRSLNGLLDGTSGANKDNPFIQPSYLPETSDLLDEIKGMGSLRGKADVCHCYLTNVNVLDSADYLVQFAYLGTVDTTPLLRASFKLVAHQDGDRFLFSSPLRRNTVGWKAIQDGEFTFYYSNYPLNATRISGYARKAREFDRKLHAAAYQTKFYCCGSLQEALEVLGVEYKLDYNGISSDKLTAFEQHMSLNVLGGTSSTLLDFHDLWHDRLHAVVPVSTINKPIDEACAYLYGGSWGLSWGEVYRQFRVFMGDNKDWLTAFTENKNFAGPNRNHLYVSYVITALLIRKIEKEKGFPAVLQFLTCGRYQPDNESYFRTLDKIIGINRSNFNTNVQQLVDETAIAPSTL